MSLAVEVKLRPGEPRLDPELIQMLGQALYGPHWISALAAELCVTPKTLRRWLAGETKMPRHLGRELGKLLRRSRDWRLGVLAAEVAEAEKRISTVAQTLAIVGDKLHAYEIQRLAFRPAQS